MRGVKRVFAVGNRPVYPIELAAVFFKRKELIFFDNLICSVGKFIRDFSLIIGKPMSGFPVQCDKSKISKVS